VRFRIWIALLTLAAGFLPAPLPARPDLPPHTAQLTLSVFNDAQVPPSVLTAARARTVAVMQQSAIALTWLDCGEPSHRPELPACWEVSYPEHLSVRLIDKPHTLGADTFGQAFLNSAGEGSYANVYPSCLPAFFSLRALECGDLLGVIVAHEVGHLLLGAGSHSDYGLMAGRWRRAELELAAQGRLLFTADQAQRIRRRLDTAFARNAAAQPQCPLASATRVPVPSLSSWKASIRSTENFSFSPLGQRTSTQSAFAIRPRPKWTRISLLEM